jgi:hypothetical protein
MIDIDIFGIEPHPAAEVFPMLDGPTGGKLR